MALHRQIIDGIISQADHVANNNAPGTAAVCRALLSLAEGDTACGRRIAAWHPEAVLRDAMPLRIAGGLHDLFRRGVEPALGTIYTGILTDQDAVDALVGDVVARHDADLLRWFDSAPQTNEAGRSASFVGALHWLASRTVPAFELNEIGASAGMNLLIDRYAYDLGGITSGPLDAPVTIRPIWNGPPPQSDRFDISSVQGCDLNPVDVRNDTAASRLMAYTWPENPERFQRMEAGIAMIRHRAVDLVAADAADWVEMRLAQPQQSGTTRVLLHSIVWQYLPDMTQHRIQAAMREAGAKATEDKPLAWISLETNRATFRHELKVSHWPGGAEPVMLAEAHAHGTWINWQAD
jgi:hypothetical protein